MENNLPANLVSAVRNKVKAGDSVPLTTTLDGKPYTIASKEGIQQEDPLGPFLFSLAIHPMLVQVRREFQSVLTPSYLDDITILGPISDVTDTYWKLKGHMSNIGLELREEKCEIYSPLGISRCQLPIREMKDGFELLGTPVGSDTFVKDVCHGKVEKLNPLLSKLSLLQDAQIGVLLLR